MIKSEWIVASMTARNALPVAQADVYAGAECMVLESGAAYRATRGGAGADCWLAIDAADPFSNGFPSYGTLRRVSISDDFGQYWTGPLLEEQNGSGGAATQYTSAPPGRVGVVQLSTSTGATNYCGLIHAGNLRLDGARHRLRWDAYIPDASDGSQTFTARVGFIDSSSAESTDGVFFRYAHGTYSGQWQCVTRSNGTETVSDSGIAGAGGAEFQSLEIKIAELAADSYRASFNVDGALVATHTANVPYGSGRSTSIGIMILKSAGTTARTILADRFDYEMAPTAPF
jgi:hypothetical protein